MPTYVYRCLQCDERFEVQQPFTAGPVTECQVCGQGPVKKVFTPVGVTFKGSGFYKTDNRSSSKGAKADAKSEGGGGGEKTSSDSSQSSTKSGDAGAAASTSSSSSTASSGSSSGSSSNGGSS